MGEEEKGELRMNADKGIVTKKEPEIKKNNSEKGKGLSNNIA
jgi:hypothetical protein